MVSLFATIAALGPFNIYGCHQGHPPGFSGGASIGAIVERLWPVQLWPKNHQPWHGHHTHHTQFFSHRSICLWQSECLKCQDILAGQSLIKSFWFQQQSCSFFLFRIHMFHLAMISKIESPMCRPNPQHMSTQEHMWHHQNEQACSNIAELAKLFPVWLSPQVQYIELAVVHRILITHVWTLLCSSSSIFRYSFEKPGHRVFNWLGENNALSRNVPKKVPPETWFHNWHVEENGTIHCSTRRCVVPQLFFSESQNSSDLPVVTLFGDHVANSVHCGSKWYSNWIYRNLPAPKTANNTRRVCTPRIPEQCVRCLEQGLCVQELPQVIVRGSWQRAHEPPVCFRQSRPSPTAVVVPRNLGTVALPKPLAALMTWAAWVHHSGICYRFCLACACRLLSSWLLLFISGLYISVLIIIVMSCSGLWRWSLSSPT